MREKLRVNGELREIRTDYRIVLEIIRILSSSELDLLPQARVRAALKIFYVDFDSLVDYGAAYGAMCDFLDFGGSDENTKIIDFQRDMRHIQAAVNISAGQPVRNMPYLHIEDFLGYLRERDPNSTISAIINIRYAIKKGKFGKLPKDLQEFYYKNKAEIDLEEQPQEIEPGLSDEDKAAAVGEWREYVAHRAK